MTATPTTWAHANVIIGNTLRRVVLAADGPSKGLAASFATDHTGDVDAMQKTHYFEATSWENAVATAETYA